MGEGYSKMEIYDIAEYLIEELRECEDGTETTTCQLLKDMGYDLEKIGTSNILDIHIALFELAEVNHIILDMSDHENMLEGLPYNLDFVVRNKKAQIKCPFCGSKNSARILYGMPLFDEELHKKLDEEKIALGGCCIMTVPFNGKHVRLAPKRVCNECKKKYGTPPLIVAKDLSSAEDYRDIVTSIHFYVGGFFGGDTEITIARNDMGAYLKVVEHPSSEKIPDRQITVRKWKEILNTLYSQMYLHEWKKKYVDSCVMDGTQWELKISLNGNRERKYSGINDYPPCWPELTKFFEEYLKL